MLLSLLGGMRQPTEANKQQITALQLTLDCLPELKTVIDAVRRHDRNLADQLKRAATSVALNLAEADGNDRGNARARVQTALGSLKETRVALRIAAAWDYVPSCQELDSALDRVARLAYGRLRALR